MKNIMIDMMVTMMPYMKPVMWLGVIVTALGLLFVVANIAFNKDIKKGITWSIRIALATATFFLAAQLAGFLLNMPPTVNFGDSAKFEFILVSFWQIGSALLIASLIIKYLSGINRSKDTIA
jgi:hypothetical protein